MRYFNQSDCWVNRTFNLNLFLIPLLISLHKDLRIILRIPMEREGSDLFAGLGKPRFKALCEGWINTHCGLPIETCRDKIPGLSARLSLFSPPATSFSLFSLQCSPSYHHCSSLCKLLSGNSGVVGFAFSEGLELAMQRLYRTYSNTEKKMHIETIIMMRIISQQADECFSDSCVCLTLMKLA